MKKTIIIILLLIVFAGCEKKETEWNPVFENTGFSYFHTNIDKSLSLLEETSMQCQKGDSEAVKNNLDQIRQKLLEMKDYYIPLTTIRQKVYDAERFYKIRDLKNSERMLEESRDILKSIDLKVKNKVFDKVIVELETMINKVSVSLDDKERSKTYKNMKSLGEHINLSLVKGELVLSGIEFEK